jgi:protein NrfC
MKGIGMADGAYKKGRSKAARTVKKKAAKREITYPAAAAYLVVDTKKCDGCCSCMVACSLVHEGVGNYSLSRIQVAQDAFARYPEDLQLSQCRQCPTPLCVQNCPSGACHISAENGNVRMIDEAKCTGCQTCLNSCPFVPHRPIWNPVKGKAAKCDLCAKATFWNEQGGPNGRQACIEVCPMRAIQLVKETPKQIGNEGYDVNLRNENAALVKLDLD